MAPAPHWYSVALMLGGGTPPTCIVYALGNTGATLYAGITGAEPVSTDWTDKNRDVSQPCLAL